jgi:hypothetical protein
MSPGTEISKNIFQFIAQNTISNFALNFTNFVLYFFVSRVAILSVRKTVALLSTTAMW